MISFFFNKTRLLFFGFISIYFASFGQTFFISIFNVEIRSVLELSNGEFGLIYSLATILSSILLIWFGKLIDWMDLRIYTLIISLGLFFACFSMFFLFNSVIFLFLILFALRFFGQGSLTHTSLTTMARYYGSDRGKAISFGTFGAAFGEMTFPLIVVFLLSYFSWKESWLLAGTSIIIIFIPLSFYLLKDQKIRHESFLKETINTEKRNWKIRQILYDKNFYIYLPIFLLPSFIITGLIFHQIFIANSKGWSLNLIASSFISYAIFSILGLIIGGPLIDKVDTKKIIPFYLLPMFIGILTMILFSNFYIIFIYMGLIGLSQGLHAPFTGALWAELYGVLNLGTIRALLHAFGVFASALSPVLFGIFIDLNFSYYFLGILCLSMIIIFSYPW